MHIKSKAFVEVIKKLINYNHDVPHGESADNCYMFLCRVLYIFIKTYLSAKLIQSYAFCPRLIINTAFSI